MAFVLIAFFVVSCAAGFWVLHVEHGRRQSVQSVVGCVLFGLLAALVAALLEQSVLPSTPDSAPLGLLVSLGVGTIEEACKFLPLALFIYRKPYFQTRTDGLIYFGAAGLAFGCLENILYTLQYGAATGLQRLFLIPFFHAAATGLVGYALARRKLRLNGVGSVFATLLAMAGFHAAYDYLVGSDAPGFAWYATALAFSLNLVYLRAYLQANQEEGVVVPEREVELPRGFRHWNWGAFFFGWIWSLAHNTWVGLLTLALPLLALIVSQSNGPNWPWIEALLLATAFVHVLLGWHGDVWGWRNRRFAGLGQFQRVELIWERWGLAMLGVLATGLIALAVWAYRSN